MMQQKNPSFHRIIAALVVSAIIAFLLVVPAWLLLVYTFAEIIVPIAGAVQLVLSLVLLFYFLRFAEPIRIWYLGLLSAYRICAVESILGCFVFLAWFLSQGSFGSGRVATVWFLLALPGLSLTAILKAFSGAARERMNKTMLKQ